jgi:hypothetical protein
MKSPQSMGHEIAFVLDEATWKAAFVLQASYEAHFGVIA